MAAAAARTNCMKTEEEEEESYQDGHVGNQKILKYFPYQLMHNVLSNCHRKLYFASISFPCPCLIRDVHGSLNLPPSASDCERTLFGWKRRKITIAAATHNLTYNGGGGGGGRREGAFGFLVVFAASAGYTLYVRMGAAEKRANL